MRIDIKGDIVDDELLEVYEWFGIPAVSPKAVRDKLAEAEDGEEITVYINSYGGSVFAGAEIYEELRSRNVTVIVAGIAASAASVITCAGRPTLISPAGCMMIHNVSGGAYGDYHEMEKTAETLKRVNRTVCGAYMEKTGKTEAELLKLMDRETWLNANDAVEFGLCNGVTERPAEKDAGAKARPAAAGMCAALTADQIERARREIAKARAADGDRKRKAQARLRLLQKITK
jgi:ATP-dependent Clp endopeptidase proteolytic subunit ClpP